MAPRKVQFTADRFSPMQIVSYSQDYTSVGVSAVQKVLAYLINEQSDSAGELQELQDDLLQLIAESEAYNPDTSEPDPENLFLIKADGGSFSAAYGPAIFNKDGQPVLKIGSNIAPIEVDSTKLTLNAGDLSGRLTFFPVNDDAGSLKYVNILAILTNKAKSETYELKVMTRDPDLVDGAEVIFDQTIVMDLIENGDFVSCLRPVPSPGGGNARKLAELEPGKTYEITGCKRINGNINGRDTVSYKLTFAETGSDQFWLNANHGNPYNLIKSGTNPIGKFLKIQSIVKSGRGYSVKAAITFSRNESASSAPML